MVHHVLKFYHINVFQSVTISEVISLDKIAYTIYMYYFGKCFVSGPLQWALASILCLYTQLCLRLAYTVVADLFKEVLNTEVSLVIEEKLLKSKLALLVLTVS